MQPIRPIFWGLAEEPDSYCVLFPAETDSDHRVAVVRMKSPLPAQDTQDAAYREFVLLTESELQAIAATSALIDRRPFSATD